MLNYQIIVMNILLPYTPDQNGNTQTPIVQTVSGATGGDISQGPIIKTREVIRTYYNIYSCGCDSNKTSCGSNNVITILQSTITITN